MWRRITGTIPQLGPPRTTWSTPGTPGVNSSGPSGLFDDRMVKWGEMGTRAGCNLNWLCLSDLLTICGTEGAWYLMLCACIELLALPGVTLDPEPLRHAVKDQRVK